MIGLTPARFRADAEGMSTHEERRRHPRYLLERPGKVFYPVSGKYYQALTLDVAGGGAVLRVATTRRVEVGHRVELGIAWGRSPLLCADRMERATVVRVVERGPKDVTIAVAYDAPTIETLPQWVGSVAA